MGEKLRCHAAVSGESNHRHLFVSLIGDCQGIVIWDGQFGGISAGLAGGRNFDDQAFGTDGDDFGWADAYRVQIPAPVFLE